MILLALAMAAADVASADVPLDIPAYRADAAFHTWEHCVVYEANRIGRKFSQMSPEGATEAASVRCVELKEPLQSALSPMAERALRQDGVKHWSPDVLAALVSESLIRAEQRIRQRARDDVQALVGKR